jgi:CHAT domain-containing protein
MGSYSQPFEYRCPVGHEGNLSVWLVVDGEEHPELLRQVAKGELTPPRCPECGRQAGVQASLSLLVRRSDKRPEILFGSTTPADAERVRSQAQLASLMLNRGRAQPVGGDALIVPYELLAVMASRDLPADADALESARFPALSPELQRYRDWLLGYVEERFKRASEGSMVAFLQAEGISAIRAIIDAHPILLDQRIDALLSQMAEIAEQEGQPEMASVARARRDLLHEVRDVGLDTALPRQAPPPPAPRKEEKREGEATLTPAVGAALVAVAGDPIGGEPVVGQDLRRLLERALADIAPGEAELLLEYRHGELVGLRDMLTLNLATELLAAPRDRNDQLEAQRLMNRLDHLHATAPHTWASVQHNAGLVAAALATPGDLAALNAARAGFERALTVRTPDDSPDEWVETLVALTNLLRQDYPGDDSRYLDESIRIIDDALYHPPPGLSPRARLRLSLSRASSVLRRAERRGDEEALGQALQGFEAVLAEARTEGEAEITRVALTNLGVALGLSAERTGRPSDWAHAVGVLREALEANAADRGLQWVSAAINLSIALRHAGDVEAAIPLMRQTLERTEEGGFWAAWAATQNNLGTALLDRVKGDRDENVEQAIAAYDSARRVWTREAYPIEWALTTARLAVAYEETAMGEDRARSLLRAAVELIPRRERPVDWARVNNRLALHEPPAAAVPRYLAAAEVLTGADFPHEWASIQNNLGTLYQRLAVGDDREEYLAAAAACYRSALDARPASDSPLNWAETAIALGRALSRRGQREESVTILRQALDVLRVGAPAQRVILGASRLGMVLAEDGRWREATAAFWEALEAADRIYATSLLRRSRERTISTNSWIAQALAYCLVQDGRSAEAVEALERGRTRLLSDALARDPKRVARARETHPEQYQAYIAAVHRLAAAEAASTRLAVVDPADAGTAYQRRAEQAVRDELREAGTAFEEARARLPELPAVPPEQPADNVLIYLFSTGVGSTALLVRQDQVDRLQLADVDDRVLRRLVHGEEEQPGLLRSQNKSRRRLRAELAACLAVIGPHVMRPVADAVRAAGDRSVTLVPVGLFSAIPLHAAPVDDGGRCLLDDVAVSYSPSAAVLHEARRSARDRRGESQSAVAVVDPMAKLAFTDYEVAAVLHWIGGRRIEGTVLDVTNQLVGVTHIHFACHGQSLADQPLESHLTLGAGRRLSLLDLLTAERTDLLRQARLVVASACQTAVVEATRTPDEFIGLAAGFLVAGVPCFVGTMWPSDDVPSALVTSRFYELTGGDGLAPDEALRQAQLWLRDLDGTGLLAHLESHQDLAAVRPNLAALAAASPDHRFYADPASWSPYIVIGAVEPSHRYDQKEMPHDGERW